MEIYEINSFSLLNESCNKSDRQPFNRSNIVLSFWSTRCEGTQNIGVALQGLFFEFPSNRFCFAFVFFFHSSWAIAAFVSTPLLPVACPSRLTELTLNWADIVLLFNKHKKLSEWPFRSRVGTFILFFADSVHVKSKRLCKKLLKCSGVQCMSDV